MAKTCFYTTSLLVDIVQSFTIIYFTPDLFPIANHSAYPPLTPSTSSHTIKFFCLAQISSFIPNGILHSNLFALLRFLDQCLIPNHGHSRIPSAMHCPLSSHPQDSFVMAICSFIASTFLNLIALCLDTSDALSLFVHAIVTHLFVPTHSSVHD